MVLQIKDGYWNASEVQITAGFLNILKTATLPLHAAELPGPPLPPVKTPCSILINTVLSSGRRADAPALDCFGIVNEIRRDLGLVRGLISPGSRKMITASIGRRAG
jgi:hypothetical protein